MPSPKSGSPGTLVSPASPQQAQDADVADPGEVEQAKAQQQQLGKGKYGSQPVKAFKPSDGTDGAAADAGDGEPKKKKTGWIGVRLVDKEGKPVPGVPYRITLPDGSLAEGTLSEKGEVKVEGFDPGSCKITFPTLDRRAWKPK